MLLGTFGRAQAAIIEVPEARVAFHSDLLGWPAVHQEPGTAMIKPPRGSAYMVFQSAEDYVPPPVWPAAPGRPRTMMDLAIKVDDLDPAVADAVALGVRVAEFQPQDNIRVLLDPAGHPFCLRRDDED